jgi:hypothetical protein
MSLKMNAHACSMPDDARVQKAEVTRSLACPHPSFPVKAG